MSKVARYFVPEHDDGSFFGGVPKGDIDEATWEALPAYVQRSVDASPMYRKTRPEPERKSARAEDKEG